MHSFSSSTFGGSGLVAGAGLVAVNNGFSSHGAYGPDPNPVCLSPCLHIFVTGSSGEDFLPGRC